MTITTVQREDVIKAYQAGCTEVKDTLEILFPEICGSRFDWYDFSTNPGGYITLRVNSIEIDQSVVDAYRRKGKPIPIGLYPKTDINMLAELFRFLADNCS